MACSIPPQLESTLRIFTQDWYPSSPPPSRPGYSVCPAPTDAGCPPRILKLSPKESGLQNQADPAPPATRHRVWSPFYRDCRHLPKASSSSSRHPWQRLGRTHATLMPVADSWEVGKTQAWEWS
nr:uncharacterized protein LOC123285324 isoform X2 [Equus asinus]